MDSLCAKSSENAFDMQGKLMTKSKVIQTTRPKSQVYKRRYKPERSNTPQRWSRRIRSLPPIPINVIKPRRKNRKKCTNIGDDTVSSVLHFDSFKRKNRREGHRERRNSVFIEKNASSTRSGSVEVVRIVPVVVYVKNSTRPNKTLVPEEIRVHIDDGPACEMVSQAIDTHIHKKIKREKSSLGYSKKIRMTRRPYGENFVQNVKKSCPSRKKMLLYN